MSTHPTKPCNDCGSSMESCICLIIKCFMKMNRPKSCCQDYMQANASRSQIIEETDVGEKINIDVVDSSRGIINQNNGEFVVRRDATYGVIAAPQAGRQDQEAGSANFRCWILVNGLPVANSNVLLNLLPSSDGGLKDVIISQGFLPLKAGDRVSVKMATSNAQAQVGTEAINPTPDEPLVPGIIFSMWELCCDEHEHRRC